MTWQGCSNPYLLRRSHGLPLYGIAEWESLQCARYEVDFEVESTEFGNDLDVSWNDWVECIDLFGATQLEWHVWDLRMRPGTFARGEVTQKQAASAISHNYFANPRK